MKKMVRNIINTLLSLVIVFSALFGTSITARAEETKQFIPFRSDYVNYLSKYSYSKSDVTQYVWLKLFKEELNWTPGMPWYHPQFASWSNRYYSNYVSSTGTTESSQNKQVTYNPEFDTFLYQTVINNPEFVINWINENPAVFTQYTKTIKDHPVFAKSVVDLTAEGKYLGDGFNSPTNVFLMGINSTSDDKQNAKWSATCTTASTHDIDILRIYGNQYSKLNTTQKRWVRTYMQWMVNDYVAHGAAAIAARNNSVELYNLIAASYEGFVSAKAQEFFNYAIGNSDVHVGDIIVNGAEGYNVSNQLWTGAEDVAQNNNDMYLIFMVSDADCDYKSATDLGDNDYDWLAYNICFGGGYWARLRTLVSGNGTTYEQMQDWLMRYYLKHPNASGGWSINNAVARAGQTHNIYHDGNINVSACNSKAGVRPGGYVDESFWCSGHCDEASTIFNKPVGVGRINLSSGYPGGAGGGQGSTYRWKIYDSKTGRVISESGWTENSSIVLSSRDTWSSTIVVDCGVKIYHGHGNQRTSYSEHVGSGECYGTSNNGRHNSFDVNGTYADVKRCIRYGHSFAVSDYNWNADHTSCTCVMRCVNCGTAHNIVDDSIVCTSYADRIEYTADFAHTTAAPKTDTVLKGSGEITFTAADLSGSASGVGKGSCSLPASKITKGPKGVTISANATKTSYTILNRYGEIIDSGIFSSNAIDTQTKFIDLSYYDDNQLEGLYVIINMEAEKPTYNSKDVYVGQVPGDYRVNYIKFHY